MEQNISKSKTTQEECIHIQGTTVILRYSSNPSDKILDRIGKILCSTENSKKLQ